MDLQSDQSDPAGTHWSLTEITVLDPFTATSRLVLLHKTLKEIREIKRLSI